MGFFLLYQIKYLCKSYIKKVWQIMSTKLNTNFIKGGLNQTLKMKAVLCFQFFKKQLLPKNCLYKHTEAIDQIINIILISNI